MIDYSEIIDRAAKRALVGGFAGACAQVANVLPLMWMRTIMEYQYCHGGTLFGVARLLYKEGGVPRFYRGLAPAIILAPIARFGDTAANELALATLHEVNVSIATKTAFASVTAATFRVAILPLDAWKVNKQVHGKRGLDHLLEKARSNRIALWHGGVGVLGIGMLGHFPWFYTNNVLRETLPQFDIMFGKHIRNACIGFASALASDVITNPLRVLKVVRQTSREVGYFDAAERIIDREGVLGLWGRGLKTRILANGMQGALFTVIWRAISESMS